MLCYTEEYVSDLIEVKSAVPNLEALKNKTILITGAGGLICSAVVDFLIELNRNDGFNINVYAAARDYKRIKTRFEDRVNERGFYYLKYDALRPLDTDIHFDYIIHGASNANPGIYMRQPVETMLANIIGMKSLLDYSISDKTNRIVYISSSEVYGKKEDGKPYSEDDYCFLDILNPRACYPSSKRATETFCASYQQEYGTDFIIVRPGHVYGPTMTDSDNRASSQFPRDVLAGKDIVMKSMGTQLRSYCYVLDCVSAIIAAMLNGESGNAYNISNKDSIVTIRDIAEYFARTAGKKVIFELALDAEKASYNLMDNSSLKSDKLEGLGWYGMFDIEKGVKRTLNSTKI